MIAWSRRAEPPAAPGARSVAYSTDEYANDEQRRAAPRIGPSLRVAAAVGHLRCHSFSTYRGSLYAVVVVPGIWPPGARNAAMCS